MATVVLFWEKNANLSLMVLLEHVTHDRSSASGVRKGGLAVNRTALVSSLKAPCHVNCHVLMSVLPVLHTFSTNPDRLTDSFIPPAKSAFLLCPFLQLEESMDSK